MLEFVHLQDFVEKAICSPDSAFAKPPGEGGSAKGRPEQAHAPLFLWEAAAPDALAQSIDGWWNVPASVPASCFAEI